MTEQILPNSHHYSYSQRIETCNPAWHEAGKVRTPDYIPPSDTGALPTTIRSKCYKYIMRYSTSSRWYFKFQYQRAWHRRGGYTSEYEAACGYDDYLDTLGIDEDERPRLVVVR